MKSILTNDALITCPNCSNVIRSSTPECSKCGLTAGEDGIRELAEIDEQNYLALSEAESLAVLSGVPFTFLILASVFSGLEPALGGSPIFVAGIALIIIWWKFFRWSRNYSAWEFPDEAFAEAKQKRKSAGIVGMIGSAMFIFLTYSLIAELSS